MRLTWFQRTRREHVTRLILRDVLGDAEDGAASAAPVHIKHEHVDSWFETEEFGEVKIWTRDTSEACS